MKQAVIVAAKRTPIARQNGKLHHLQAHEIAAPILKALACGVDARVDEVILGNVVGPGGNIARLSALQAGLPFSVPGVTLDRQCSAGLEAIRMACLFVNAGAGSCYIAGGVESVSTSPFPERARFSPDSIGDPDMGVAAEYVAEKFAVTREMQDEYALLSWKRSRAAFLNGHYVEEMVPLAGLTQDEVWQRERNMEKLVQRASPAFIKNGTVTAANSCGFHDGASAVLVMEEGLAQEFGYKPVLRFVDSQVSGVHPYHPGYAPVPAIEALLQRNGLATADVDLFEINEAFASKIAACARELSIPYDKINVRGGALAIGHPYGASGAVLVTRLFYEVQRRPQARYVVAAIGSGGGVGVAVLFEAVSERG